MSGFSNPIIGGSGALVYPQVMSPNFNLANPPASPSPSWAILKNGLAYFFGLVVTGGTVTGPDYIINSSGIFIYSGAPAAGNMIGSWAGAAGTDSFGNHYLQGLAIYGSSGGTFEALAMFGVGITLWSSATAGGPWTASTASVQLTGQAGGLTVLTLAASLLSIGMPLQNPLEAVEPGTTATAETWHPATLQNGWTNNAGTLQYKLLPWNAVWIVGVLNPAAMTSTTFMTLPALYAPNDGQDFPLGLHNAGTAVFGRVLATGAVQAINSTTTTGAFGVNVIIPLDW